MNITVTIPEWLAAGILYAGYGLSFTLAALILVLAIVGIIYKLFHWRRCWGMARVWLTYKKLPAEKWTLGMLQMTADHIAEDCPEHARAVAVWFNEAAKKHETKG